MNHEFMKAWRTCSWTFEDCSGSPCAFGVHTMSELCTGYEGRRVLLSGFSSVGHGVTRLPIDSSYGLLHDLVSKSGSSCYLAAYSVLQHNLM